MRPGDGRGKKTMPKKLQMFVFVTITSTPSHRVNKDSCRVHHSNLVAVFVVASTQRTDIPIMSKVESKAEVLERYDLVELTIPPLKPMKWKRPVVTPLFLSWLHALRLCFLLTIYVRPDRFYRLPDSLRTLPLSRYLAALVSTRLILLTFLFRLAFPRSCGLSLLTPL